MTSFFEAPRACFVALRRVVRGTPPMTWGAKHLSMTRGFGHANAGRIVVGHDRPAFTLKRRQASIIRGRMNTEHLLLHLGFG